MALGPQAVACPSLILKASLLPLASISSEFHIKTSWWYYPGPGYWTLTCSPSPHALQRRTALCEDESVRFCRLSSAL